MMACLGCKLANKLIETNIVYENEYITCFLDHNPYNEGHILILPKKHMKEIIECDAHMTEALTHAIKLLSRAINATFTPDGITVMQNGGLLDDLTHLHIHLIPRYQGQQFSDFFIENELDIKQHEKLLPITKQRLIEVIKRLGQKVFS